jgi:hypothetical protein
MIDNFALIIGAMKCGTTSLFSYLAQHPQISACSEKEPRFFSNNHRWAKGFDWYQNLWHWKPTVHKIALEASVDYTRIPSRPNAAQRIATLKAKANFKFIYIMRNPLDRIESHYTHGQAQGWLATKKPLSEEIDGRLIEASRYATQIEEYYKRFSADSILLLNFEDLKTNPLHQVKKVCQFLEIDPDYNFQELDTRHNANEGRIGYDPLWRSLRRIKLLRSMAQVISVKPKRMLHSFFGRQIEGKFKLSPAQRDFILSQLKEDLQKLSFEYGIELSKWGIKQ